MAIKICVLKKNSNGAEGIDFQGDGVVLYTQFYCTIFPFLAHCYVLLYFYSLWSLVKFGNCIAVVCF